MKLEQVLRIYWEKSFLYGGLKIPFDISWRRWEPNVKGFGFDTKLYIIQRFELQDLYTNVRGRLSVLNDEQRLTVNRLLSKVGSIQHQLTELTKFNIVRLFLIKSFRGKSQAFGKPSHGQRTWSNAWTAYLYNKTLRTYIVDIQKYLYKETKVEKVNYKLIQKKIVKSNKEGMVKDTTKKGSLWF